MSSFPGPIGGARPSPLDYDRQAYAGVIARFFNAVYAWMAAGLAVTALVAWWVSTQPQIMQRLGGPMIIGLFIIEIILVMTVAGAVIRIGPGVATVLFLAYAALNGVTLSFLLLMYTHAVLASAFVITAGTFGVTSVYGMVTRRDLTRVGSIAFMGLIGIIIASVVSLFWHPNFLTVAINYIGVLVFVALTAYDTQRLTMIALQSGGDARLAARLSVSGALALYLDFLNLFIFIVSILGNNDRRR